MPWLGWYPPILAYHCVSRESRDDTPTVSEVTFTRQMEILRRDWNPIPLGQLVECLEQGQAIPPRAVVVTFDDGTQDTYQIAFPVLRRYRIPATVFVITGNIDRLGFLTTGQLQEMSRGGVALGSHTCHHAYLPELSPAAVGEELIRSKQHLESLGLRAEFLSFPAGGFSAAILQAVQAAGYRASCTTNRGFRRFPVDRWALRRISMHEGTGSPWGVWLRVSGYYTCLRRLRNPA